MTVSLLIDGIEVKEWWWPDVHFGFDKDSHERLEKHINAATANCQSEISALVNSNRCTWCVKIKSRKNEADRRRVR